MSNKIYFKPIILLTILFLISGCGLVGRGCKTANEMLDQTYLNADKNVWSYEQFHANYQRFLQYEAQIEEAEGKLTALKIEEKTSGYIDTQARSALIMEISGARQMKKNIAEKYNEMSSICYQKIWKSRGLPESLPYT